MLPQNKISGTKIAFGHGAFVYEEGSEKGFYNFLRDEDFAWNFPADHIAKMGVTEQDLLDCVEQIEEKFGNAEDMRAALGMPDGGGMKPVGEVVTARTNPNVICSFTPTSMYTHDTRALHIEEIKPDGYFEWFLTDENFDMKALERGDTSVAEYLKDFDRLAGTRNTNLVDSPVVNQVPTYSESCQMSSGVMGEKQREHFIESVHRYHRMKMPPHRKAELKKGILETWERIKGIRETLSEDVGAFKTHVPLYLQTESGMQEVKFMYSGFMTESRASLPKKQGGIENLKKFCESEDNLSRLHLFTSVGLRPAKSIVESDGNLVLAFEEQVLPQDENISQAMKNLKAAKPIEGSSFVQGFGERVDLSNEKVRKYNKGLIFVLRSNVVPMYKDLFNNLKNVGIEKPLVWYGNEIYQVEGFDPVNSALISGRPLRNQTSAVSVLGNLNSDDEAIRERGAKRFGNLS